MNKKAMGGTTIIILVIVFILIILGLITLLIILNQKEVEKQTIEGNSTLSIYIEAKDSYFGTQIGGEYLILNKSSIIRGKLSKDSYTEVNNLSNNLTYPILVSSAGFYSQLINKSFTQEEKDSNTSKIHFSLNKVGEIDVTNTGNIQEGEKLIVLNVSSKDYFNKLEICVSWTSGIVSVTSEPQLICDGVWENISGSLSSCNGMEEECDSISGSVCYPKQKEIPIRLKKDIDKCFYYGNNLKDSSVLVPFRIKSENINSLDSVTFVIIDNDVVYFGGFKYMSDFSGINLGMEDFQHTIKYNETI